MEMKIDVKLTTVTEIAKFAKEVSDFVKGWSGDHIIILNLTWKGNMPKRK